MRVRLLIVLLLALSTWAATAAALAQESSTTTAAAETTTTTSATPPPLPQPAIATDGVGDIELDICNGVEVAVPVTSMAPVGLTIDWAVLDLVPFGGLSLDPPGTAFGTSLAGGRVDVIAGNSDAVLDPGETWKLVFGFSGFCTPADAPPPYAIVAAAGGVVAGEDTEWCVGGAGYCPGATDPIVPIGTATIVILSSTAPTPPDLSGYGPFDAWAHPTVLTPHGGYVTYWINPYEPDDLPVMITGVSSSLHGDVADPFNPLIEWTTCSLPVDWQPGTDFGWAVGWGCKYNAWVDGSAGDVTNAFSVAFSWGDGTRIVHSVPVVVTISDDLGAIHGIVFDEVTGVPISGLMVFLEAWEVCGRTEANGRFSCTGLESGQHLLFTGNSHWTPSEYAFEWYDDGSDADSATPINVAAGEATTIEWGLSIGGVIEGAVMNETTGDPIPGVRVQARGEYVSGISYDTDGDGSYRIAGLPAGDYVVCFDVPHSWELQECWDDRPNGGRNWPNLEGDLIHVELGEVVTGIDATIAIPAPSDEDGNGASGNGETLPYTGFRTIDSVEVGVLLVLIGLVLLALPRPSRRSAERRERTLGE